MDTLSLGTFYRSVQSWPKNSTELSQVAEKVRALLDAPVVAVGTSELGFRVAGLGAPHDPDPQRFVESVRDHLGRVSDTGRVEPYRFQLGPDQALYRSSSKVEHWTAFPIRDQGWVVVGSDKPLQPKSDALLVAAAQHLGSLFQLEKGRAEIALRDQFLSIASHELKTPLTSIYGILQLQERMLRPKPDQPATPEQEKQHQFFKIVIRQVQRLNELIDGLLDVSRIQNGRFVVEPSDTDVAHILHETVTSRLEVIAREAGVKIDVDAPEHLSAWVDPVRFEEVVTNLGMNAIRFSPEGGVVRIKLLVPDGERLVLSFRDQGPPLTEADRQRIFQPFERAQRTSRLGGLGLGLFISRQIAQLHGGNVTLAESVAGKGNLFEAVFPVSRAQRASA